MVCLNYTPSNGFDVDYELSEQAKWSGASVTQKRTHAEPLSAVINTRKTNPIVA